MGAASSGHWWSRFAGILHKLKHWLHVDVVHAGFVYVDDSLWTFAGLALAIRRFALILLFYRILGVPLS